MKGLIEALYRVTARHLKLWHGGDLEIQKDDIAHKKGRWEAGPGLYATTHYDTAKKYAKGRRKLYQIDIKEGNDIKDVELPLDLVIQFVNTYVVKKKRPEILQRLNQRSKNDNVSADILNNIMINEEALRGASTNAFRKFLVENGVDYSIQDNMYGWHERVVVIFNPNVITNKKRITPQDKIEVFDLPTQFS